MSFTDGKPFIVTEKQVALKWGTSGSPLRCGCCGHTFAEGDTAHWQYTNDTPGAGGNPFVCVACDGTKGKIVAKLREHHALRKRMGWVYK